MPWGKETKGGDESIKPTKADDAAGGLKTTNYSGEMTADVRYTTGAAATGAANICSAGQPYYPELEALFAGEL